MEIHFQYSNFKAENSSENDDYYTSTFGLPTVNVVESMPTLVARICYTRGIVNTWACRVPTLISTHRGHCPVRTHYIQNKSLIVGKCGLHMKENVSMFKPTRDSVFHEIVFYYSPKFGALERLRPKNRKSLLMSFSLMGTLHPAFAYRHIITTHLKLTILILNMKMRIYLLRYKLVQKL